MTSVPFDTLKLARQLQAAGFSPDQADQAAEALAEAVDGSDLATKTDLALLRKELKFDTASLLHELQSDMQLLRRELKSDMELLRRDLTIRMSGLVIAGAGVMLAGMRLML